MCTSESSTKSSECEGISIFFYEFLGLLNMFQIRFTFSILMSVYGSDIIVIQIWVAELGQGCKIDEFWVFQRYNCVFLD